MKLPDPALEARLKVVPESVAPHTSGFAEASGGEPGRRTLLLSAQAMTVIDLLTLPERMQTVRGDFEDSAWILSIIFPDKKRAGSKPARKNLF